MAGVVLAVLVRAAGPDQSTSTDVPSFVTGKHKLDAFELEDKVEGSYFTGLPLVDSDPDTGYGFGAKVYRYWDGPRSDPLFEYTPYRHQHLSQ
jgi:hypothetical protein